MSRQHRADGSLFIYGSLADDGSLAGLGSLILLGSPSLSPDQAPKSSQPRSIASRIVRNGKASA
jgi:hypothetical protein